MTDNLQDKLCLLESKQTQGAKLRANIRWELELKCSKTFFKILERQNMQNETKSELYTDDNNSKYSCNPKDNILKSAKKINDRPYTRDEVSKAATTELLI